MQKKSLGRSGLSTPPFILGTNVFGWTIDEATSFSVLDAFIEAGFNTLDTADVYSAWKPGNSGGESETIIGHWMKRKGNRSAVVIATKVGSDMGEGQTLRKDYIIRAAEASLRRLQTDYIDLYQSHWDDPATPVEETLEAYAQLIRDGKVRAIGASNFSAPRLKEAIDAAATHGLPQYSTFQPEYNLYDRSGFETQYAALCLEHGVSVIPYYGLAKGFLSGKYRSEADLSKSARGESVRGYLNERGFAILTELDVIAAQYEATPAAIALAWLAAQPAVAAPIASATSTAQVEELSRAAAIDLDEASLRRLSAI